MYVIPFSFKILKLSKNLKDIIPGIELKICAKASTDLRHHLLSALHQALP